MVTIGLPWLPWGCHRRLGLWRSQTPGWYWGRLGLLWVQLLFLWLVGTGHFSASWSQQLGDPCAGVICSCESGLLRASCQPVMNLQSRLAGCEDGTPVPHLPRGVTLGPPALRSSRRTGCGGRGTPISAQSTVGRASTLSNAGCGSQPGVSVGRASLGARKAGITPTSYRASLSLTRGSCSLCEPCGGRD